MRRPRAPGGTAGRGGPERWPPVERGPALEASVPFETLRAVIDGAVEIGREGREGKSAGTPIVVGDVRDVLARARTLGLDPFKGSRRKVRKLRDLSVREAIEEIAQSDGAFVVARAMKWHDAETEPTPGPAREGHLSLNAAGLALPGRALPGYNARVEPTATQTPYRPSELPTDRVRIVSTPGACGGRPRIDGHRVTIEDVAIRHERMGMSPDEIVSAYQSLALSGVRAALAYDDEQRERIDAKIRKGERFVAEVKAEAPPSLLQRTHRQREADAPDDSVPPR